MKLHPSLVIYMVCFLSACTERNPLHPDQGISPVDRGGEAQIKFDGYATPDGDGPVVQPDLPVVKPDLPVTQPDLPVIKPDLPVIQPDLPAVKPDMPVSQPDMPVIKPDLPVIQPDLPVTQPDLPVTQPDLPVNLPDSGPLNNSLCAGAAPLSWAGKKSITVSGSTSTGANEYGTSINCGNYNTVFPANQHYYKVALTGGKAYRFTFAPKYGYARMYLFQACGITSINAACGSGGKTGAVTDSINYGQSGYILFKPATSGTWIVALDGTYPAYKGNYSLTIDEYTAATNDSCGKALKLTLVHGEASVTGNTAGAMNEFGTGINCGYKNYNFPAGQLYYKFSAKAGHTYLVKVKPSFYAAVYAFRSNLCTAAGINADCASGGQTGFNHHYVSTYGQTFTLKPQVAGDYTVAVDSRYATSAGSFTIDITEYLPQTNATCAKATQLTLTGGKVAVHGDTFQQANEYGQSILCDQTYSSYAFDGPQQYYKLSFAKGKTYKITVTPGYSYGRFYVFGATCGATAINKDCGSGGSTGLWSYASSANQPSVITFSPSASGVYHIAVDSTGTSFRGLYKLEVQEIQSPDNGTCIKAQAVSLTPGSTTVVLGDNSKLPNEFGTQIFCNNYSTVYKGNQAYFKFTLTAGTTYTFTLRPKYKNSRFYIFDGSCKPSDINQDCGSNGQTGLVSSNSYAFNAVTMTFKPAKTGTYHLAVDSTYTGTAGFFSLEIK